MLKNRPARRTQRTRADTIKKTRRVAEMKGMARAREIHTVEELAGKFGLAPRTVKIELTKIERALGRQAERGGRDFLSDSSRRRAYVLNDIYDLRRQGKTLEYIAKKIKEKYKLKSYTKQAVDRDIDIILNSVGPEKRKQLKQFEGKGGNKAKKKMNLDENSIRKAYALNDIYDLRMNGESLAQIAKKIREKYGFENYTRQTVYNDIRLLKKSIGPKKRKQLEKIDAEKKNTKKN